MAVTGMGEISLIYTLDGNTQSAGITEYNGFVAPVYSQHPFCLKVGIGHGIYYCLAYTIV